MRFSLLLIVLAASIVAASSAKAEDQATEPDTIEGMEPVMVSIEDRDPPSDEEWEALQTEQQRFLISGLNDFKSRTISFMETRYYTPNSAEGTLASYGKMSDKDRYDRYGHIEGVAFDPASNSWKERFVMNAAALLKLTGKGRFEQYADVELATAVNDKRQIEVTFVGTIVPKDEAIRRLNADLAALEYLGTLHEKRARYDEKKKLPFLAGGAPPKPKVVLANVMMLDRKTAKAFEGSLDGKIQSVIHNVGGDLKLVRETGEETTLLTPVVRCYRTYSIEFKTGNGGRLHRVARTDAEGNERHVPIVFDLTPDL
jgi:hypothetical protein